MFAAACAIARAFTRPVVVSTRFHDGRCTAGIGAFIVVNPDGWAVTAWHIIEEAERQAAAVTEYRNAEASRQSIYADLALHKRDRAAQLKALPTPTKETVTNTSTWWSWDAARIRDFTALPAIDLAVFRLQGFDATWVTQYPRFKDPSRAVEHGTSLCRLGFPFHGITPHFHADRNGFELPPGSLPLPLFPNDGIFTRTVEVPPPAGLRPPFPLRMLETSTPGLKGQSGGPIFDTRGTVWAVQSRTVHYPLGFSPPVPNGKPNEKEHQFLNVGWGVHPDTLVGVLRDLQIPFELSDY